MEEKRIGIVHGLMHTYKRWQHLAGCFACATSMQLCMMNNMDDIAKQLAPRLEGYDILIGHSMGGLVIHKALERYNAPRPEVVIYVSVPFQGVRVPGSLSPLVKVPKTPKMVRAFSLLTVTHPEYVDDIMIDDVMSQDFAVAAKLLRELCRYRSKPVAVPGVKTYNIVAQRDHVSRRTYVEGATNILFKESGHTIPLEFEEKFVQLVKRLGKTK